MVSRNNRGCPGGGNSTIYPPGEMHAPADTRFTHADDCPRSTPHLTIRSRNTEEGFATNRRIA